MSLPVSAHSLSPSPTGWNNSATTVTLSASDNNGGSGVKEIRYSVDMGAEQTLAGASGSFTVADEGVHTIAYYAVDFAGNVEATNYATVKIDKTAPTLSVAVADRQLTLSATDALSGVGSLRYKIDNGAEQTYTGPVNLGLSAKLVTAWAIDVAGNQSSPQTVGAAALLKSVAVSPSPAVNAGSVATVTVALAAPAPSGGLVVDLSSSSPALLPLPATVTVPAGKTSASVTSTAGPVATDQTVQIEATFANQWARTSVAIQVPPPKSLTLKPSVVTGGGSATATVTLASKAPAGGQVVEIVSLDPSVATAPATVLVPAGAVSRTFSVSTIPVSSDRAVLITAETDGSVATAALTVRRIAVSTLKFGAAAVTGGSSATGTLTLSRPAPTGGLTVALSGWSVGIADGPSSVVVPGGATAATFTATTSPVVRDTGVTVRASLGGSVVRTSLTVLAPRLTSLTLTPSAVKGGSPTALVVTLSGAAPTGGVVVSLVSGHASVTVPASAVVPAGSSSVLVTVTTTPVSGAVSAPIKAVLNLDSKTANLAVKP